ncbi:MAG: DUF3667 domain-containing protein [Bacteroidales bacterium]
MESKGEPVHCPNCLADLPEDAGYCPHCGQKKLHSHDQSVWHLVVESVGDFFHLDSKFFATVVPLAFRPGFLTSEFLAGRRAKYFQPIKLFLFISFLYFLTSGLIHHKSQEFEFEKTGLHGKTADSLTNNKRGTYQVHLNKAYEKIAKIPDDSLRRMIRKYGLNVFIYLYYPHESAYGQYVIKQVVKNRLTGSSSLDENMGKTLPKLVFILIPFLAFLLKLVYYKKRILYFDHVIFSMHFLSFYFFLFWIKEMLSSHLAWVNLLFFILLLVYLFIALERVYQQGKWLTLGKFCLLLSGTLIILGIFFILAALISFVMI